MEEDLANLKLLDEDEEAFQEEAAVVDRSYQFCLVGRCLTDSVVHFHSLRNTMADLWHPIGGICITCGGDIRWQVSASVKLMDHSGTMRIWKILSKESDNWRYLGSGVLNGNDIGNGPMDQMLEEENDQVITLEGKKRKRIVEGSLTLAGNNVEASPFVLTASSGE
ncbi:hypothetical protein J1N35_022731 [Gossypium stocksii]|uniref:DUF4283 domain-containing protein n=1 Tax=Gossypium stocksii TaxID=47602 RepID=A0A9D3VGK0_9ROSI|nr:hypothetical protein J1N35_022731 [Gossypium stocksii]